MKPFIPRTQRGDSKVIPFRGRRSPNPSRAIHGAANGQVQLAPNAADILMRELRDPDSEPLSPCEIDGLLHLVTGMTNKAIAGVLVVGAAPMKTHIANIPRIQS
jgi:DNA-binding NarL/FixJ family response regulator